MNGFRPPGDLPELRPAPGQVEEALRQVGERRRRALRRAGSSACAALVAALLVTSHEPSTSMLEQTDQGATRTATAVPTPTGHGRETDRAEGPRFATPSATATSAPGEARSRRGGDGVRPAVGVTLVPSPTVAVRARPAMSRVRYSSLDPRYVGNPATPSCGVGAAGHCTAVRQSPTSRSVELTATVCARRDPYELRFPGEQEADLVVRDAGGAEVWRWSLGQFFAPHEEHTIALAPDECVSWTVPWDYRDERGVRVPKGRYTAALPILSDPGHDLGTSVRVD